MPSPPPLLPPAGEATPPPPPPWLLLMAVLLVVGVLESMNGDAAAEYNGEGEGGTEERQPVLGLGLQESGREREGESNQNREAGTNGASPGGQWRRDRSARGPMTSERTHDYRLAVSPSSLSPFISTPPPYRSIGSPILL